MVVIWTSKEMTVPQDSRQEKDRFRGESDKKGATPASGSGSSIKDQKRVCSYDQNDCKTSGFSKASRFKVRTQAA